MFLCLMVYMRLCFYGKGQGEKLLVITEGTPHLFYHTALKFSSMVVPCAPFRQLGIDATVDITKAVR